MPRFKVVDYGPRFLPVDLSRQLRAGTFEYALHHLLDHEIDLSEIESCYCNDEVGASAYAPRVLLKLILLAYSHGIVSSRGIEAACRNNVQFIALSGDSQPDHSTLATFVSSLGEAVDKVFTQVLMICERQGLIGREMFAIDGVKLPSNASKAKSGKRKDFMRQAEKMHKAVEQLLSKHRDTDAAGTELPLTQREQRQIKRLTAEAQKIRDWLEQHPYERKSAKGKERLSNRTDNESAKMATGKGVVQGYTGVAAVDEKHQVIVQAQAHGTGSEYEVLSPMADALWDKSPDKHGKPKRFRPQDFQVAEDFSHCICPAGKRLYRNGNNCNIGGRRAVKFTGAQRDCETCPLRAQCLRHPQRSKVRQVAIFVGTHAQSEETAIERMKRKTDSDKGREMITRRFATVEPVFGNIRNNKGMNRFTLRGQKKVDGQWKLYCMVHNIEKPAHNGYTS
jgi:transposase